MPDVITLPQIAEHFGVTMDFFFDKQANVEEKQMDMNNRQVAIEVNDLVKQYEGKNGTLELNHLNLKIYKGISTAIM